VRKIDIGLRRVLLVWAISLAAGGCNRYYTASSDFNVATGVTDCKNLCSGFGMEMFGIVTMHDTNSGCICRVNPQNKPAVAPDGGGG
jgi:hypothetical protein